MRRGTNIVWNLKGYYVLTGTVLWTVYSTLKITTPTHSTNTHNLYFIFAQEEGTIFVTELFSVYSVKNNNESLTKINAQREVGTG
jgi:hypothetical protein